MNNLLIERKKPLLDLLVEGGSLRGISRATGHHRNTIVDLMHETAQGCRKMMMDERFANLTLRNVQVDEVWTFVGVKRDRVPKGEMGTERRDQFLFTALDDASKLIRAFYVGKRTNETALRFMNDLKGRVRSMSQLSTDAFWGYADAVDFSFGVDVNYAQVVKTFRADWNARHQTYSPQAMARVTKSILRGKPDPRHISTSYIERSNLTLRQSLRRFSRLTIGFSKKLGCLISAVTVYLWHYNFQRGHKTLHGATPAMAQGVVNGFVDWQEVMG